MNTKFSAREEKIIRIIGATTLTIDEISRKLFTDEDRPLEPGIAICNAVNRIIKKCNHYKYSWTLNKENIEGKLTVNKVANRKPKH